MTKYVGTALFGIVVMISTPRDIRERMKVALEPKGEHVVDKPPGKQ